MSLEKDIQAMTAALDRLTAVVRHAVELSAEPRSVEVRYRETPEAPAPEIAIIPTPHGPVIVEPPTAAPLTFEDVKQAFLGIARSAPDPVEGTQRSKAVLARYGAAKLKDVEETKWPAFIEDCRAAAGA